MSIKHRLGISLLCLTVSLNALAAEEFHFVVKNKTKDRITKLEVSENKKNWGNFDIGDGIGGGKSATLVWAESTNDQACDQWIRAKFADGSWSEPVKEDFCHDLDDPIEFTE